MVRGGAKPPSGAAEVVTPEGVRVRVVAEPAPRPGTPLRSSVEATGNSGEIARRANIEEPKLDITKPPSRHIVFDPSQLQAKFKHAKFFGITGNWNKANAARFRQALEDHVSSPTTRVIRGTYHGQEVIHHYNPATQLNVMTDLNGNFISGWKLSPKQIEHLLNTGSLGEG